MHNNFTMSFSEHTADFNVFSDNENLKIKSGKTISENYTIPNTISRELALLNKDYYSVLTTDNKRLSTHKTLYFDTPKNKLFLAAHNRKRNRQLVCYKHCIETKKTFLEIKFINKKGRATQKKLNVDRIISTFSEEEITFLSTVMPKKLILKLEPRLSYNYKRKSLVDKSNCERINIDFDIKFIYNESKVKTPGISFVQIKTKSSLEDSMFKTTLRDLGIRKGQINKYVTGMSIFGKRKSNFYMNKIKKITRNYD